MQGKVSILAHSLGSVLCYEILCNQPHLFDHLEFNLNGLQAPLDTSKTAVSFLKTQQSTASKAQQQQQPQQQQQQHRQASTEIAFAPMSSRDLDDSYQAAKSCPAFPMPLAKPPAHTVASLHTAAGTTASAEVRQQVPSTPSDLDPGDTLTIMAQHKMLVVLITVQDGIATHCTPSCSKQCVQSSVAYSVPCMSTGTACQQQIHLN